MARGNIYEVTTDLEYGFDMDEVDFYDKYEALQIDYVENMEKWTSIEETEAFIMSLAGEGAETGFENKYGIDVPYFSFSLISKKHHFESRLHRVKALAEQMTLTEFSSDSTAVWNLREAVEDNNGDCIYMNGSLYTLDKFIRDAETGVKYYLNSDKVVLMH